MPHVVVTGAGGFVGGFAARFLAKNGIEVSAITRRTLPPPADTPSSLRWIQADLLHPAPLPRDFDVLIHCAAEIPARCDDPLELYRRNVLAAQNVFEAVVAAGARAVVFLSSMSVYGTITTDLVTEDTQPQAPDAYGRAKGDIEALLAQLVASGLPSGLAIRLPGTVGKGSHDNFLSTALGRILQGLPVRANNPDNLFNNIVYVGDLARFLLQWIRKPVTGLSVTNLAAMEPVTIRDLIFHLFSCAGRTEEVVLESAGKASFLISLDRALSLGYSPATVRRSIESFVLDSLNLSARRESN